MFDLLRQRARLRSVSLSPRRTLKILASFAVLLPLFGCATLSGGFLISPAGPVAIAERHEFIIVGIIMIFVIVPVFILIPLFAWHYRISNNDAAFRPQWGFSWILEVLIWLPPTGIVVVLAIFLCEYTVRLDPYRPLAKPAGPALQVDVVSLDWKWLFIYPAQHLATVNEVVIPAGTPVHFDITSGTVMQSLLMPRLAGQIYAMAGMQTQLNFAAAKPGDYMGENTQYNGNEYQQDKFKVEAVPPAQFAAWVTKTQANPVIFNASAYHTLSQRSVLSQPVTFGRIQPGIYQQILAQKIPPGYLTQKDAPSNG